MKTPKNTITPEAKTMAVAIKIARMAHENNGQYKTSDKRLAMMTGELMSSAVDSTTIDEIEAFVDAMIKSWKIVHPAVELWTYFCCNTNWLSWAWHDEEEEELSKAWAKAWYKINHFSLEVLTGDDLKYYIEKTD